MVFGASVYASKQAQTGLVFLTRYKQFKNYRFQVLKMSIFQWVSAGEVIRKQRTCTLFVIEKRSRVHMPSVLLSAYNQGQPMTEVRNVTDEDLRALVQWSDLIVFDYITGHYDR